MWEKEQGTRLKSSRKELKEEQRKHTGRQAGRA